MLTDDPTLLPALRADETRRLAELVARHDRTVRALVARAVRDPLLREEVVQQTFCLAFRGLAALAEPDRTEAWLARIARNAAVDALRRRDARRRREQPLDELDPAQPDVTRSGWIWDEVARLAAIDREILELRYREGLSYRELAARLAVPESTVRGRIYEARRALRRRLERMERDP